MAREITLLLNFLGDGEFTADIYTDSENDNEDPNLLNKQTKTVTRTDNLSLKIAAGGGQVMRIRKK